jgi:hypothetical protein
VISKCRANCKNASQDALHGANFRVLNEVPAKGTNPASFRCTVCGTVHSPSETKGK